MTNPAKRKGDQAEREAAALLADLTGWPVRRRLGGGRADDCGDLDGVPDTVIQVKSYSDVRRAVAEALADLEQQRVNAGATHAAGMIRRPGGRWLVVMSPEHLATLLREAVAS